MAVKLNQLVWYWRDGQGRGKEAEPAVVTAVHDGGAVDLWVFCQHGAQRTEDKVWFKCEESAMPLSRFATADLTWPEKPKPGPEVKTKGEPEVDTKGEDEYSNVKEGSFAL